MARFCNFCKCLNCRDGAPWLSHAPTEGGFWICDVCFTYDLCTSGPNRNPYGPCEEDECEHRPRLVGPWQKWKPKRR